MDEINQARRRPVSDTPLKQWLAMAEMSRYRLAKLMSVTPQTVSRWCDGQLLPGLIHAFKLDQVTQGGVPPSSWLGTEWAQKRMGNMGADWDSYMKRRAKVRVQERANIKNTRDSIRKQEARRNG